MSYLPAFLQFAAFLAYSWVFHKSPAVRAPIQAFSASIGRATLLISIVGFIGLAKFSEPDQAAAYVFTMYLGWAVITTISMLAMAIDLAGSEKWIDLLMIAVRFAVLAAMSLIVLNLTVTDHYLMLLITDMPGNLWFNAHYNFNGFSIIMLVIAVVLSEIAYEILWGHKERKRQPTAAA